MLDVVLPIFLVIVCGYIFAKTSRLEPAASKLINDFVLFVSLPALLFLAVAQAEVSELLNASFVVATLSGIVLAYVLGLVLARFRQINSPQSAIIAMSACYGTTGYMGIPIAIVVLGQQAAVPAAIATLLHNIPAIMTVMITFGLAKESQPAKRGVLQLVAHAVKTTLMNPLTLAVLGGSFFAFLALPLPAILADFSKFLGGAAGPTALFALGFGLAGLNTKNASKLAIVEVCPIVIIKLFVQPAITLCALYLLGMPSDDLYFQVALLMAAQPIGAGAFVFANQYQFFQDKTALAIIFSLIIGLISIPAILSFYAL